VYLFFRKCAETKFKTEKLRVGDGLEFFIHPARFFVNASFEELG
jgi:hypothetical protein